MNRIAVFLAAAALTIFYLGCNNAPSYPTEEEIPPFTGALIFTDFSPQRALAGDTITLYGNFSNYASQNTVAFNGVVGEPVSSTGAALKVRVPAGNSTGKIEVKIGENSETSQKMFVLLPDYSIDFTYHHTANVFNHFTRIHPYEFDNKMMFTDSYRVYLFDLLTGSYHTLIDHTDNWSYPGCHNIPPSDCAFYRPVRIAYYLPKTALILTENDGNYYSLFEVNENIVIYRGTTTNNWRRANDLFYVNGEIYLINHEYGQTGIFQSNLAKIRTIPGVIGMNSAGDFFSYQDYKLYRTDNDGQATVYIAGSIQGDIDGKGNEAKFFGNSVRFLYADDEYIYVLDTEMGVSHIKKVNATDGMVTTIFIFDRNKDINLANLQVSSVAIHDKVIYSIHNRETRLNRILLEF